MLLKIAALILLSSCLGQCCYPDTMQGNYEWIRLNYTYTVNYTARISVQRQDLYKGYEVFYANKKKLYMYAANKCWPSNYTNIYQDPLAPIPDDAKVVKRTDDTITYSFPVPGGSNTVTVTNTSPCFPLIVKSPRNTVIFYNGTAGFNLPLYKTFLEECKMVDDRFDLFII